MYFYTLYDKMKIFVEIDDANEYKYKIIPLGDTSNPYFDLRAGLKYGTKTIYPGITVYLPRILKRTLARKRPGVFVILNGKSQDIQGRLPHTILYYSPRMVLYTNW